MKKLYVLFIVLCTTLSSLSAGNVITYTATEKLPETEDLSENAIGLYIFGFNTDIRSHTFLDGVGTITFSDDVTSIGEFAFSYCTGLTSITIPNSVTSIGWFAFGGCTGLTSITIPNSVTEIGRDAFRDCTGLTSITIGNSVTSIGWNAFKGCTGLTSITIPNSVTSIGESAFERCTSLTSIEIPNSVTSIGSSAFDGCTGLTSITIGNSVTSIGWYAFGGCTGLTSITIPNSVTSIGKYAFYYCTGLTSVTIGNSVTSIGYQAFDGCNNLKSVSINSDSIVSVNRDYPSSISSILFGLQVTEYILGDDVHSIGDCTFYKNVNLISVSIGNSVTSIGENAFEGCTGLTSITIPNSVTSIGAGAFYYCTGLTSITIPNSVTSIGNSAFEGCTGLTSIIVRAMTPPKCNSYNTFDEVPTTISVYIPCGTKEAYQSAWGYFQNYIEESEHTLAVTTQNEDMGAVQVIQEPSCPDGNSVFKAVANKGYHFVQWNDGNTDNPRTVAVIQDTTFVAEFAPGSEYTIIATCNSQQGTVSGSGVYAEGTPVTLTATAYEHYNFTQWTDGNTDNPRKITAERDATYTAEFAIDQHSITATCDPQQGSITGTGTYDYGTRATLTATANKGYEFLQWSNGIKDNPYSFTVVDNITLEAQFIPATAVENVSANDDATPRKVLRDGQVYILRNGKVYTIQGQEIKE